MNEEKNEMINKEVLDIIKHPTKYKKEKPLFNIKTPLTTNPVTVYFKCPECGTTYDQIKEKQIPLVYVGKNFWRTKIIEENEEINVFLLEGEPIEQFCEPCVEENIELKRKMEFIHKLFKENIFGFITIENKKEIVNFFNDFCREKCYIYRSLYKEDEKPEFCRYNCFPLINQYISEIKENEEI